MVGTRILASRLDLIDLAENLIGSELHDVGIAVLLKAHRNIAGQFRLGQQASTIAGALGSLGQTVLVASV